MTTSISKNLIRCGLLYNIKGIKKKSFEYKFILFIKKKHIIFKKVVKKLGRGEVFHYIFLYSPGARLLSIEGDEGDNSLLTWLNKTLAPGEYNLE